jgi:hypothetical protein
MDICGKASPPPFEVAPGHVASCWLHGSADGRLETIQSKGVKEAKPP